MKGIRIVLGSFAIAALFGSSQLYAAEKTVEVVYDGGTPVAQFNLGDSSCTLKEGQIRCTKNQ